MSKTSDGPTTRIVIFSGNYPPSYCGVGHYCQCLTEALTDQDADVLVTTFSQVNLNHSGSEVRTLRDQSFKGLKDFTSAIRTWHPSAVHLHFPYPAIKLRRAWIFALIAFLLTRRCVHTWHEPWPESSTKVGRWLDRVAFVLLSMATRKIIVVRENYLDLCSPFQRAIMRRVPLEFMKSASTIPRSRLDASEREGIRAKYLPNSNFRLLAFFGFISPNKRIECLLEGLDVTRFRLMIIGASVDRSYESQLKALVESKGLEESVHFLGNLSSDIVANLLHAADVVTLPFAEGGGSWSTSVHAALIQGTPVVMSAREANFENEGVTGVPIDDWHAFWRAVDASSIKKRVTTPKEHDPWQQMATRCLAIYREIA